MVKFTSLASSSRGNCFHITDGSTQLLLECGIPFKNIQRQLNFKTSELAACLVTHEHGDHSGAIQDVMKAGIDCYMSEGTRAALGADGHRIKTEEAKRHFRVGTWIIMPFQTEHDASYPFGYLLYSMETRDKLLFATDTYYIKYKFRGLTHIAIECNYAIDILNANVESGQVPVAMKNRILKSHFSLTNVKEFLKSNDLSKVCEIHLLHLSNDNSDAGRFKREIQELTGKAVYVAGE